MSITKTKWTIKDMEFDGTILIGTSSVERTDWICQVNPGEADGMFAAIPKEEGLSNVRLIVNAPELLETTKQLLDSLTYWIPKYGDSEILNSEMVINARNLLAKINGVKND